jgi:hypothetical protein
MAGSPWPPRGHSYANLMVANVHGIVLPVIAEQDSADSFWFGSLQQLQRFWVGTIGGGDLATISVVESSDGTPAWRGRPERLPGGSHRKTGGSSS